MVAYGIWGAGERFKSDISNFKSKGGSFIGIAEEWKPLMYCDLDLTDRFLISNTGKLYSLVSKKILKTVIHKEGYEVVCVSLGSRKNKKLIRIHVAVACMFVEGYKDGLIVNHKDTNKLNNVYTNLEWTTPQENTIHAYKMGRIQSCGKKIYQIDPDTKEKIGIFNSIAEATRLLNPQNPTCKHIYDVLEGRKKMAYGYEWEFISNSEKMRYKHCIV